MAGIAPHRSWVLNPELRREVYLLPDQRIAVNANHTAPAWWIVSRTGDIGVLFGELTPEALRMEPVVSALPVTIERNQP